MILVMNECFFVLLNIDFLIEHFMKNKIAILFLIVGATFTLQSCFLFGGGKSKCGDCPTWSQNAEEEQHSTVVVSERS